MEEETHTYERNLSQCPKPVAIPKTITIVASRKQNWCWNTQCQRPRRLPDKTPNLPSSVIFRTWWIAEILFGIEKIIALRILSNWLIRNGWLNAFHSRDGLGHLSRLVKSVLGKTVYAISLSRYDVCVHGGSVEYPIINMLYIFPVCNQYTNCS